MFDAYMLFNIGRETVFKSGTPDKFLCGVRSENMLGNQGDIIYKDINNNGQHIKTNFSGSGNVSIEFSLQDSLLDLFTCAIGREVIYTSKTNYSSEDYLIYGSLSANLAYDSTTFSFYPMSSGVFDDVNLLILNNEIMEVISYSQSSDVLSPTLYRCDVVVNRAQNQTVARDHFYKDAIFGLRDSTNYDIKLILPDYLNLNTADLPVSLCMEVKKDDDYFLYNGMKVESLDWNIDNESYPEIGYSFVYAKEEVDSTSQSVIPENSINDPYSLFTYLDMVMYKDLFAVSVIKFGLSVKNTLMASYLPGDDTIVKFLFTKQEVSGSITYDDHDLDNFNDYVNGNNMGMVLVGVKDNKKFTLGLSHLVYEPFAPALLGGLLIIDELNFTSLQGVTFIYQEEK